MDPEDRQISLPKKSKKADFHSLTGNGSKRNIS